MMTATGRLCIDLLPALKRDDSSVGNPVQSVGSPGCQLAGWLMQVRPSVRGCGGLGIRSLLLSREGVALTGVQHSEQQAGPSARLPGCSHLTGESFSDMPTAAGWAAKVCECER